MTEKEIKELVWANVSTLMQLAYGRERLGKFAEDCGIGAASMTRLKKKDTAVGIDVVAKIANAFGISPWQVMAPALGEALYTVNGSKITPSFSSESFQMPTPRMHGEQPHLVSDQEAPNASMKRNRASRHQGDAWMQSSTELRAMSKQLRKSKRKPEERS